MRIRKIRKQMKQIRMMRIICLVLLFNMGVAISLKNWNTLREKVEKMLQRATESLALENILAELCKNNYGCSPTKTNSESPYGRRFRGHVVVDEEAQVARAMAFTINLLNLPELQKGFRTWIPVLKKELSVGGACLELADALKKYCESEEECTAAERGRVLAASKYFETQALQNEELKMTTLERAKFTIANLLRFLHPEAVVNDKIFEES